MKLFFRKNKIGLALGSGGAKGIAHIGVLKVLEENGIRIDFISGSSIGALIGGYYAVFKDAVKLESAALDAGNWKNAVSMIDPASKGGIIAGEKVEKYLYRLFEGKSFEDAKIPFKAVATDFNSGNEIHFSEGDIVKAIRASISVPALFKPLSYNKTLFIDGGISNPIPDNLLKEMGAQKVIAVNLDAKYSYKKLSEKNLNVFQVSMRTISIFQHHLSKYCLNESDVVIEPEIIENTIVGFDQFFKKGRVQELIKLGETATLRKMADIKKLIK